jgi:hypothetical protein
MKLPFPAYILAFPLLLLQATKSHAVQVYHATDSNLGHSGGRKDDHCQYYPSWVMPCWTASSAAGDAQGMVLYGQYVTNLPAGDNIAEFTLGFPSGSGNMAQVEVYDFTSNRYLAKKVVKYTDFIAGQNNKVSIGFNNDIPGHALEFRVYWFGVGRIDIYHVVVAGQYDVRQTFYMDQLSHLRGRFEGSDYSCNVAMDEAGTMTFGPYVNFVKARKYTALFKLLVDNNTANNAQVATIEVYNYDLKQVLATKTITRMEFTAPWTYNYFPLKFYTPGHFDEPTGRIEFRVFWKDASYMKQTALAVHDWGVGFDPQF